MGLLDKFKIPGVTIFDILKAKREHKAEGRKRGKAASAVSKTTPPMGNEIRRHIYQAQNGTDKLTTNQLRRMRHKANKESANV